MADSLKSLAESKTPGVQKQTSFKVDPRIIEIEPGFNRPIDPAHVAAIKEAKKNGAVFPPLSVRVSGARIIMVDGEHRWHADMELIEEGHEIMTVDCVQFRGNDADRTMHIVTSASGKPLTPLQMGIQYRKLIGFGWSVGQIAARAGKSTRHVDDMIALAESNSDVQHMVNNGEVAAHVALKVVKQHGDQAGTVLQSHLNDAKQAGKGKVTAKAIKPKEAPKEDRRDVLLRAAYDLMKEIYCSPHADAMDLRIHYDGTDCDGQCLMEDIANLIVKGN